MGADRQPIIAYLATLAAIVTLSIVAAMVCIFGDFADEVGIARVIGALSFISAAITGLIGVIGTFRPKGPPVATTQTGDVNLEPQQ